MPSSEVIVESVSRSERRRQRNREALVSAARRLFARDGIEATTIAGITGEADLGFGTFYRYFPDKEAALEAVLDEGRREIDASIQGLEPSSSAAADLCLLTERFAETVRRNRDVLSLMWQLTVRTTRPGRRIELKQARETSLPVRLGMAIGAVIQRGIAGGEFDADVNVRVLAGLLAGAHMYLLSGESRAEDERQAIVALQSMELRALGVTARDPNKEGSSG
jgi:AcrR family transcriptional regulator